MTPTRGATCDSCDAPITWVVSKSTGNSMPIDRDPVENGNIVIESAGDGALFGDNIAVVLGTAAKRIEARMAGRDLFINHFVTCPHSALHRKP